MKRMLIVTCMALLPGIARADLGSAKRILSASCAHCHTMQPGGKAPPSEAGAPDLVTVVRTKSSTKVLQWLKGPSAVNPKTACDVSGLDARFASDLVNYLVGLTSPAPARRGSGSK